MAKPWVVIRKTEVIDDRARLPRPKLTYDVIIIGDKQTCLEIMEEMALDPKNQSTDQISVELKCVKYANQKTSTSTRKNNGRRQISPRP